jgi:hypothetical protein
MESLLIMFRERPVADCIQKVDANIAAGLCWSWLGCRRELVPHIPRLFSTLSRNSNVMVRTRPVWGPYQSGFAKDLWLIVGMLQSWSLTFSDYILYLEIIMEWSVVDRSEGPWLCMFGERPLIDCIQKADATFGAGLRSWLGSYRELVHHFLRCHTLSRNSNAMVSTRQVWGHYYVCLVKDLWSIVFRKQIQTLERA